MPKLFNAFENFEQIKITKPIRLIELFAGVGAQAMALRDIGATFEHYRVCEFDKYAIQSYNAIHGTSFSVSDIRNWKGNDLGIVDKDKYDYIMTYSFPCFVGDTLITTDKGLVNIKDIKIGDHVLTHDGTYQIVVDSICTGKKELFHVKTQMGGVSKCTGNHKIYVREKYRTWNNERRTYDRFFKEPKYVSVEDLSKSNKFSDWYVGFPINTNNKIPVWSGIDIQWDANLRPNRCDHKNEISSLIDKYDFWWIIGRYVADGWIRSQGGIVIAYPESKENELLQHIDSLGINYNITKERTCNRLHIPRKEYSLFVDEIGRGASNKRVPQFIVDLPKDLLEGFLMGYLSGDGSFNGSVYKASSVSRDLIYGMSQIVAKVFNRVSGIYYNKPREKYVIENAKGLTNYFYDLYNKETGTYTLPKILRFGPIKQVIEGGKALSIGGFLNYGLRKGIYQSLSEDKIRQLTYFEGYDETTAISPDSKLACVMTTRFSDKTSFEIVGLMPTPYSILASYLISIDILNFSIFNLRTNSKIKGNIGPALVDLSKVESDKTYKGENLKTSDLWNFNGFISWSPDGTKIMFDEVARNSTRRCQIVRLKNYKPSEIKFEDNFNPNIPYARTIEETINLHLDYPININVPGKSGKLQISHEEKKVELTYDNFSEDNEIFYNGKYIYEKVNENGVTNSVYTVNIKSEGKKKGNCDFRLWFDDKSMLSFEQYTNGKNKSYGSCNYEGKVINVDIYKYDL